MRKLFSFALGLLLLTCLAAPALADVVWEPGGDSFYDEHYEECEYLDGTFVANGADGYVAVYETPVSQNQTTAFTNGTEIYIGYSWTDENGTVWGVAEFETRPDGGAQSVLANGETGWLDMAQMTQLYDANAFWADHQSAFTDFDTLQTISLDKAPMVLWTYPGSGVSDSSIDPTGWGWTPEDDPAYDTAWTDADGNDWAYISYYYGQRGWICLGDPANEELPVTVPTPTVTLTPAVTPPTAAEKGGMSQTALVIVLVVLVVVATAVILAVLLRKKKTAGEPTEKPTEEATEESTEKPTEKPDDKT